MKTDWKDDIFEGNRKYQMITNDDGTVSFVDVTEYTQEGDVFGAAEMNEIAGKINDFFEKDGNEDEEPAEEIKDLINDINDGVNARTQTKDTVFNSDGSITEILADGRVKTTVFNSDGSITETLADGNKVSWRGVTTFNPDGSIKEEIFNG